VSKFKAMTAEGAEMVRQRYLLVLFDWFLIIFVVALSLTPGSPMEALNCYHWVAYVRLQWRLWFLICCASQSNV